MTRDELNALKSLSRRYHRQEPATWEKQLFDTVVHYGFKLSYKELTIIRQATEGKEN